MWFTRLNEHDANQIAEKQALYFSRGEQIIGEDKISLWYNLVNEVYSKQIDRDVVLDYILNGLQLLSLGIDPNTVASILAKDIDNMVEHQVIAPVEGCMVRDEITRFNSLGYNLAEYFPADSYLGVGKSATRSR